jgi:hypothetical protein
MLPGSEKPLADFARKVAARRDLADLLPELVVTEVASPQWFAIESLRKGIFSYGQTHPERARRFPRGAVVIRQGHVSDFCYLIRSGTLGMLVSGDESEPEKEIALRYANEFIGETAFLQRGVPRTATVIVRSKDAVLIDVARADLYSILAQDPSLHGAIAALWELSASRRRETAAVLGGNPTDPCSSCGRNPTATKSA